MRCTSQEHYSQSAIEFTYSAFAEFSQIKLATVVVGALVVPQARHATTTVTTSTTTMTMAGGKNAHLIETTYETYTTGLKRDASQGTKTESVVNDCG
jgi:hypothetical protein